MFEIQEFTEARLASVTNRIEKHGDEDVPAVSLTVEFRSVPLFTTKQMHEYAGACVQSATAECSEHWQRRLDAAVAAERERCRAALQEAETIMGHNDEHTDWRERWQHLWPWGGPNGSGEPR